VGEPGADGADRPASAAEIESWNCPTPIHPDERVVMGHGGGGRLSAELVEQLFLPAFGSAASTATPTDAAVLGLPGGARLAFTTDTYVVRPLFFPGGDIGQLSVFGTVNDLAMSGATPLALSTAFVLEEGLELEVLAAVATSMGKAAIRAGVELVTGDTKVVERGHGDGLYVNTAGIGVVPDGVDVRPDRATPGDVVMVSGPIGMHGIAVLSLREGLEFGTDLRSDTAPLAALVAAMLAVDREVHVLRDLTRGGLATSLCELADTAGVGVEFEESSVPVPEAVRAGCGFLGLDPLHVANEGKLVTFVDPGRADEVLEAMRNTAEGAESAVIGRVVEDHPGVVVARTALGSTRVVDRPLGEQLPRIC
jgi:hydrogenase expression/formation protein HypE